MASYEKFKKSKLTDFAYRFLFWFSIAYFLHVLASESDGNGGAYIAKAITNLPSSNYAHTLGVLGILVGILAMILKELEILRKKNDEPISFLREVSSFIAKISTDLLFVVYGIESYLIGVGFYYYFHDKFQESDAFVVMLLFPIIPIHMFLIASISILVRSSGDDWLLSKWLAIPQLMRYASLILAGILFSLLFWYRK